MADVQLAACGALAGIVCILSPLHKHIKRHSNVFWTLVPKQLGVVAAAQAYRHQLLDAAVAISAATVTLEFYLTLLPLLAWCGLDHLVALLVTLLGGSGYVVFALKDLLEAPRPADCLKTLSGKLSIVVRDVSGDIEDGIPSAHCSGSVLLLFYAIDAATAAGLVAVEWRALLQLAAVVWVAFVAWGRMYLGLHSPIDLVTGSLLGLSLLKLWQQVQQVYDVWLVSGQQWLVPAVVLVSFVLLRCYPMPSRYTSCYQYATAWVGGWAGVTLGYCFMHPPASLSAAEVGTAASYVSNSSSQGPSQLQWLIPATCTKIILGLALLAAVKIVSKTVLLVVLQQLFGVMPRTLRCLWQPPVVGTTAQVARVDSNVKEQSRKSSRIGKATGFSKVLASDTAAASDKQGQVPLSSKCNAAKPTLMSSSTTTIWELRHDPSGVATDVVTTARFLSFVAVGFFIFTLETWWQPLIRHLVHTSSLV
eukprot:gene5234-5470_t